MVRKLIKTKDICEALNASGDNSRGTFAKYGLFSTLVIVSYYVLVKPV